MTSEQQYVIEVEWAEWHGRGPAPRLIGPFDSEDEARTFAWVNVANGAWNVVPLCRAKGGEVSREDKERKTIHARLRALEGNAKKVPPLERRCPPDVEVNATVAGVHRPHLWCLSWAHQGLFAYTCPGSDR